MRNEERAHKKHLFLYSCFERNKRKKQEIRKTTTKSEPVCVCEFVAKTDPHVLSKRKFQNINQRHKIRLKCVRSVNWSILPRPPPFPNPICNSYCRTSVLCIFLFFRVFSFLKSESVLRFRLVFLLQFVFISFHHLCFASFYLASASPVTV